MSPPPQGMWTVAEVCVVGYREREEAEVCVVGWGLIICISHKLPGDADVAGPGAPFRESLLDRKSTRLNSSH